MVLGHIELRLESAEKLLDDFRQRDDATEPITSCDPPIALNYLLKSVSELPNFEVDSQVPGTDRVEGVPELSESGAIVNTCPSSGEWLDAILLPKSGMEDTNLEENSTPSAPKVLSSQPDFGTG